MKIVYIEANPGNGGAEEYAVSLAIKAREAGHDVRFVLGDATGAMVEKVREANFDMLVIPMKSSFNLFKVIGAAMKLRAYISDNKPDIVHAQMLREQSLVILAKLFGVRTKLVRSFHRLDQFNGKMRPLMWIYRRYTDGFIATSEYVKAYLAENGLKKNVFVVHNGVPAVTVTTKKKGLGFLGRLAPEKGIKDFVLANSKLLTGEPLIIGGDGPDMNDLGAIVSKKGLKAKLLGQISDKNAFFGLFNVLVLPSSTEALPLVVLEAFSAGTPVVAFDIPPLRGLINGENGILVKPGDYKQLAKNAAQLSNSKEYGVYSDNARSIYLHGYALEKMWFDTERLYDKIRAT